ncbi:GNAT family N-acetyltransferase [Azospirillum sp. B510]|uniref:GNAT family N-acetyltransferase n=1 Tax=Azospirillum sp. (strain B510) TaxID=137722 RepID=UPI0005AA633A|nr:GNAT family N-acetyltransferase [Azospirillum sp. B510]
MIRPMRQDEASTLAPQFAPLLPWLPQGTLYAMMRFRYERRWFFVAERDGEVVGIGAYGPLGDSRRHWLLGPAATLPTHRGKGVGTELIKARMDVIRVAVAALGMVADGMPDALIYVSSKRPLTWVRFGFAVVAERDGSSILRRDLSLALEVGR